METLEGLRRDLEKGKWPLLNIPPFGSKSLRRGGVSESNGQCSEGERRWSRVKDVAAMDCLEYADGRVELQ